MIATREAHSVAIPAGTCTVVGDLRIPAAASGLVLFAHGSGSSRFSERNRYVADVLGREGLATLLLDLLTRDEERVDVQTAQYRFDIERLGHRVSAAVDWVSLRDDLKALPIGCFGASTGAAAALRAAADRPASIQAVVSRGGRPDLAGDALPHVQAPTLLIVGGNDETVIDLNRAAMRHMRAPVELEIVPGATHLFEEPGALEQVARHAAEWFRRYLGNPGISASVVPMDEWSSFLASFASRHRAWLTTITIVGPGSDPQELARTRPLGSIGLLRDRGRIVALEVWFSDHDAPRSVVVLGPTRLRVEETARGAERGLDLEDRYGRRTSIRFRATALPETVDGIVAAEL
jgi:dienelactone hydrolase